MSVTIRTFDELNIIARPRYLFRPMIELGSVGMLFGPSGLGKTFITLDMALDVATGQSWAGMPTRALPVIYVSAEGGDAVGRRVRAWYLHAVGQCATDEERQALVANLGANFHLIPHAVQVADAGQREDLIGAIKELHGEDPIGLVVLDTVARNAMGIEENSNTDMGRFVDSCYSLKAGLHVAGEDEEDCGEPTVLLVHHTGKVTLGADGEPVERGASALKGGLDFSLALDAGPPLRILTLKLKDAAKPNPMAVNWAPPVIVGYDWEQAENIYSMVALVDPPGSATAPAEQKIQRRKLEEAKQEAAILGEMVREPRQTIRHIAESLDMSKSLVGKRVKWLMESGRVTRRDKQYIVGDTELFHQPVSLLSTV